MHTETMYERLEREFHCEHEQVECRRRLLRNSGTDQWVEHVWRQCVRCGKGFGAVGKSGLTAATVRSLPNYNEKLQQSVTEARMARMRALQQEAQTQNTEEWWTQYQAYITTPEWRRKRAMVLERDRHICQACRMAPAVQVHHTTYVHLGNEPLWELQSVCMACHEQLHGRSLGGGS